MSFRHQIDPDRECVGYKPLPGLPRDKDGSLILEYVYAPKRAKKSGQQPTLL